VRIVPVSRKAAIAVFLPVVLLVACLAAGAWAKPRDPANAITSQLICPCSCGEVLSGCTCETGKSMQGYVENALKNGKTKDQIVGALVAQYGEVIRGAPKPQGFNLLVWVAPFAATLLGFVIVYWILRRMVRRRAAASAPALAGGPREAQAWDELRERAEAELRRLRE
jgi:cytochrome c-type biogenesis protein CcmH/NrfF